VVLVRQYRYPVAESVWEVPAGLREPGEEPLEGARRELEEEVGLRAARLELLGDFFTTPGFCDERLHLYRATELETVPSRPDDDEDIEVLTCSLGDAMAMVDRGAIRDAKTLVALLAESRRRAGGR
jgi:ADP-ribose pyrophosphatase